MLEAIFGNIKIKNIMKDHWSAHYHEELRHWPPEEALEYYKEGEVLVIKETNNKLLPVLKKCAAIITEADGAESHAAIVGLALNKPVIVGAKNAVSLLKTGANVYVYSGKGIVTSAAAKYQ